ncbi:PIG-L deacetylase family protein [Catellatospora vulcania]|uniref:PIG-L deacetylase family protein n=1 Tax=Catellatospora vulcania TaxID=1460450 RepID=UPI0012D3A464|nr:PIG-L family deacetylase [Catellatospora vulcania]
MNRRTLMRTGAVLGVASALALPRAASASAATAPPILFVAAHPDDETLAMSVAIAEACAAGRDVHVLLLTDGERSGALAVLNGTVLSPWWGSLHRPAVEGYAPFTAATMAAARVTEARNAVAALSSGLPGRLTLHRALLPDGAVTVAAARLAVLSAADRIAPGAPVALRVHSDVFDYHRDHVAAGAACRALRLSSPGRFGDLRYYVEPPDWMDTRLGRVRRTWDTPATPDIAARATAAYRAYGTWAPAAGTFAIGYHSVYATHFVPLLANPRCMSHV